MNILVTGAAGYIGSVITERLLEEGHQVIALDNLVKGHRQALCPEAHFVNGDLNDTAALDALFSSNRIDGVMHLAADSIVSESVAIPHKYFSNNIICSLNLLNMMQKHKVNKLVFSSSAAVYGVPEGVPIDEGASLAPVNPYGETKLMFEKALKWYGAAYGIDSISLRYFNAAGATSTHGEHHDPETHLIPNVLKVALGKASHVAIFGSDYCTEDGTCVRDYVHVLDIADAHLKALSRIDGAGARAYNLGNQRGYSVLEVVKAAEKVTGIPIPLNLEPARAGDPPALVAASGLARQELGWTPEHNQLEDILNSAWQWQKRFPEGYRN